MHEENDPTQSENRIENPLLLVAQLPDGGVFVHIDPEQIDSVASAGVLLADLAHHLARMFASVHKSESEESALGEILEIFQMELDSPTDTITGGLHQ
jgi:hypothetical protein